MEDRKCEMFASPGSWYDPNALSSEMTSWHPDSRPLATSRPPKTQVRRITQTIEEFENQLTIRLDSIFAFAHLGMELRMRRMPNQSLVSNYYATTPRLHVTITSTLTKAIPSGERLSFWKD